jgi:hypothetical protein
LRTGFDDKENQAIFKALLPEVTKIRAKREWTWAAETGRFEKPTKLI